MSSDQKEHVISTHGAGVYCQVQNKVLLVQMNYGKHKGQWILPGGMMENSEHPHETALREFKEETNLTVKIKNLLTIRHRRSSSVNNTYWLFNGVLNEQEDLSNIKWDTKELIDVKFWNIDDSLKHQSVRSNTKHFITIGSSILRGSDIQTNTSSYDDMVYLGTTDDTFNF